MAYKVKRYKGKHNLMIAKVDLCKAYDFLEWDFLKQSLSAWGFSFDFITLVMSCVQGLHFSLLLNESICGSFISQSGLWQSDPMSPLLFILSVEFFSRLVHTKEVARNLRGVKVGRGILPISHLLFVDDILLTNKTSIEDATTIKKVLIVLGSGEIWKWTAINQVFFSHPILTHNSKLKSKAL